MILEKQLYRQQFEEKWYSQFQNVIWAEDLFDIDVIVYQGKLSNIEGYRPEMTEEYTLVIVLHNLQKIKSVDVFADVDENRLYIPKEDYYKYRNDIELSMARYMESNYCLGTPGDHVHIVTTEPPVRKKQPIVSEAEKRKQSLLDNHAYSYFFEAGNTRFHDRSCALLADIPVDKLTGLTEYPRNLPSCKQCRYAALVREACSPHVRQMPNVMGLLRAGHISSDRLKEYVLDLGMKFEAPTADELQVAVKEDKWIIKKLSQKKFELWHNNYRMIDNETRIMVDGYHNQDYRASLIQLLLYISMYEWSPAHVNPAPANTMPTVTAAAVDAPAEAEPEVEPQELDESQNQSLLSLLMSVYRYIHDKIKGLSN